MQRLSFARVVRGCGWVLDILLAILPLVLLKMDVPFLSPLGLFLIAWACVFLILLLAKRGLITTLVPRLLIGKHRMVRIVAWLGGASLLLVLAVDLAFNVVIYVYTRNAWSPTVTVIEKLPDPPARYFTLPPMPYRGNQIFLPISISGSSFSSYGAGAFGAIYDGADTAGRKRVIVSIINSALFSPRNWIDWLQEQWIGELSSLFLFKEPFPAGSLVRLNPRAMHRWLVALILRGLRVTAGGTQDLQWTGSLDDDWVLFQVKRVSKKHRSFVMCTVYLRQFQVHISGLGLAETFCDFRNPELVALLRANRREGGCPFCRIDDSLLTSTQKKANAYREAMNNGNADDCSELFQELATEGEENLATSLVLFEYLLEPGRFGKPSIVEECYCTHFASQVLCKDRQKRPNSAVRPTANRGG